MSTQEQEGSSSQNANQNGAQKQSPKEVRQEPQAEESKASNSSQQVKQPEQTVNTQWGVPLGSFCNTVAYCNNNWRERVKNWDNIEEEIKSWYNYVEPEQSGLKERVFTGIKYQCVEYARRFMVTNQNCAFGDIHMAWMIFDMPEVDDLSDPNLKLKFLSFPNDNTELPKRGDLLIFEQSPQQPYGHVAVVTDVNLENQYIEIIEQNYDSKPFPAPNYSRQIKFNKENGRYHLTNLRLGKVARKKPADDQDNNSDSDEEGIIGWKRVDRPLKYLN